MELLGQTEYAVKQTLIIMTITGSVWVYNLLIIKKKNEHYKNNKKTFRQNWLEDRR